MRPILLTVDGLHSWHVYSYGLFVALGFVAAIWMVAREAGRQGFAIERIAAMLVLVSIVGFTGSRALFVALDAPRFARTCLDGGFERTPLRILLDCSTPLQVWQGGLVWYGGLVAGVLAGIWYARRVRWPYWVLADVFAAPVAVGLSIGRLGCFAAGCCFGKPTTLFAGVTFPPESAAAHQYALYRGGPSPPLHPTQLYEAVAMLTVAGLLLWLRRCARLPGSRVRPGTPALFLLVSYSFIRFAVELFRGDVARHYLWAWRSPILARFLRVPAREPTLLSTSQAVSAGVLLAALVLFLIREGWRSRPDQRVSAQS